MRGDLFDQLSEIPVLNINDMSTTAMCSLLFMWQFPIKSIESISSYTAAQNWIYLPKKWFWMPQYHKSKWM